MILRYDRLKCPIAAIAAILLLYSCNSPQKELPIKTDSIAITAGMVLIPEGPFQMGSPDPSVGKNDERPVHCVYLESFYIDKYEVTNRQYKKFVDETGYPAPEIKNKPWLEPFIWKNKTFPEGRGDYPVVLVSWHDASAYAKWAGKRLPTEAEWEKACRGKLNGHHFPFGNRLEFSQASFNKGYVRGKKLEPVGTYLPNSAGLYDIAGNVWEWCFDWYDENYYQTSPGNNPEGPDNGTYRVYRGGSWINDRNYLRCAARGKNVPEYRSPSIGFRCALTLNPEKPRPVK